MRTLLRRCLDRDPRRRLRDIGEARVMLESVDEPIEDTVGPKPAPSRVVCIARDPRLDIGPSQTLYSSTQLFLGHTHGYDASVRDNEVITVLLDDSSVSGHGDLTLVTAWPGH